MRTFAVLCVALVLAIANADIYLQYPRGSNNRLDEANRGRNNGNRLFDSQNNNRGGYNVGSVYYYTGTTMHMEWTNQHSCGNPNNNCEIILQYTCDDLLRDGTTTNTIPDTKASDTNPQFGRHESWVSYNDGCKYRSRNRGLFTANQNLQGRDARFTRQNPNGNRNGYECPEERDYYPYWHPTMWRDIAIMTNQPTRCAAYQQESQNVKSRWMCVVPDDYKQDMINRGQTGFIPINATECVAIKSKSLRDPITNDTLTGQWVEVPAWNLPPPTCRENAWSRDNHLGNGMGGEPLSFNWTVPEFVHERCVIRLRYNVSTSEYPGFSDANSITSDINSAYNSITNAQQNRDPAKIDLWTKYGLNWAEVNVSFNRNTNDPNANAVKSSRGYVLKNDPQVDIFGPTLVPRDQSGDAVNQPSLVRLQIAVDTSQFGRTFEDRSHRFAIRARPAELKDVRIHNIQVRGKRGNIVQTYPGTEYDFFPSRLEVRRGEYVHFQWTGSNTNPDNNAGQGKAGTDRHNVVLLRGINYNENQGPNALPTFGQWGNNYPSNVNNQTTGSFLGFSLDDMKRLATLQAAPQLGGNMDELDDASTYFDLGPRQVTKNGIYHYVSTRNNNFSNRDQKGKIVVSESAAYFGVLGVMGGRVSADSGSAVTAAAGAFTQIVSLSIISTPRDAPNSFSGSASSDFVEVQPASLPLAPGSTITVHIPFDNKPLMINKMYRSDNINGASWETVSASFAGGVATADVDKGGVYVVESEVNWGAIVGIVIGCLVVVAVAVLLVLRYYYNVQVFACFDKCSNSSSKLPSSPSSAQAPASV